MRTLTILPIFSTLALGCSCLPEPGSDASAPAAGLIVEYREPGGQRVAVTVTSDTTVTASADDVIAVVYSGDDDQGLRQIRLAYDMILYHNGSVTQPLLAAIQTTSSCPREVLLDSHNFDPGGDTWRYEFATEAENWVGTTTRSPMVTVRTQ